jgi:hypothetical protein
MQVISSSPVEEPTISSETENLHTMYYMEVQYTKIRFIKW